MEKLRKKILAIDNKIISLIGQRMKIVGDIGKMKKTAGIPMWDKKREEDLRAMYCDTAEKCGLSSDFVNKLFDVIFEESRGVQNQ